MPARPQQHPLAGPGTTRSAVVADHATIQSRTGPTRAASERQVSQPAPSGLHGQDGSVAMEYGLLAVVAATIVSVVLEWATSGGITSLLEAVIGRVGDIVGL